MLLPLTYRLDSASALIMFAGIYYGGMYGGSTTSILLNTPGESASIVTALEGHRMARAGRGATALATAAIGSFIAGTIGTLALSVAAPPVADFALRFGPPEYFALMVVAVTTVAAVLGHSALRGLLSLALGLAIGLVGIDVQTGQARLTLGIPQLLDGIDVVVLVVGLFAVGEALYQLHRGLAHSTVEPIRTRAWMSRGEWRRSWPAWPTFLSYALERRISRHPDEFGHGAIEGVAGPEAANNASAAGVMVPLLTIGLPTSATAAVILTAFQSYGLQPGPQLFTQSGPLVWTLIASLYLGNVMLLVLNLPLAGIWARLLMISPPYLYGGILVFSTLGVYAVNGSVTDLLVLYAIGLLGFVMRAADVPIAPAVVGLILGPLAEQQLRRALAISQGDLSILLSSPICVVLLSVAAIVVLSPLVLPLARRLRASRREDPAEVGPPSGR